MPISWRLLAQTAELASDLAFLSAGSRREINRATMDMTTNNSMRVKPCRRLSFCADMLHLSIAAWRTNSGTPLKLQRQVPLISCGRTLTVRCWWLTAAESARAICSVNTQNHSQALLRRLSNNNPSAPTPKRAMSVGSGTVDGPTN